MGLYTKKRNTFSIKNILFLIIAILFCYLIYFFYSTYTQQNNTIQNSNDLNVSENNQSLQLNELEPLIKKIISERDVVLFKASKEFKELINSNNDS